MNRADLSLLLVVMCLAGCSDGYGELGLVDVTGKVTLDGQPLAGALVRFEVSSGGAGAEGKTDAEGKYRLMYDSKHPGCPPGPKMVRITLANVDVEGADPDAAPVEEGAVQPESLPAIYNRRSNLKADVSPSNREFSFDLKSKP